MFYLDEQKKKQQKLNKNRAASGTKTHVFLQDKHLKEIKNVPVSKFLTVLYLHNNQITKLENLDGAINLTILNLQGNKLKKIEGLTDLRRLKKLFLGHNEIAVVENLDYLSQLEELHIEKQSLEDGVSLCFDPRSVYGISKSLRILNASDNNITSIACLAPLEYLIVLNMSNNALDTFEAVTDGIRHMHYLKDAFFSGNPISKVHRFRENVIACTHRLKTLDRKEINETTRDFIKRFEYEKSVNGSRQSINLSDKFPNLPKNYPPTLQKAVSVSILKDMSADVNTYLPWKSLPLSSVDTTNKVPPLLRRQKKRAESKKTALQNPVKSSD